ncbi:MAG: M1 family metallopeptidase [Cyclonatronaceae bacterium]
MPGVRSYVPGVFGPTMPGVSALEFRKKKNALLCGLFTGLLFLASCAALIPGEPEEHREKITEEWSIPSGPVQVLRELTWDLKHQKLSVRFDFEQEQVIGSTEMLFISERMQDSLIFDAKTMAFDSIFDVRSGEVFAFDLDSATVSVNLDRPYAVGDTLVLGVSFVSEPPQRGLYFVNPTGEDPAKPTQVWTLGQPADNSFWFPTIDHPAERATQETWISVPDHFQTLSNGLQLDSRVLPGDSLRTDYWRLHQPHAPYLFVLAAGEFEIIEEKKSDVLYRYYIEPEFVNTVHDIYKNTTNMVHYAEQVTGVAYPWDPVYAQAPVHDFIARGMENTTATLLYDAVQFDRRAALDLSNQDLIMHEVIHQWFGNLVTCKDWANLPLNEGFANYFESAYRLHLNGMNEYLWKIHTDRMRYFAEAENYRRPVVFYQYEVPEDMYDRHTYQKAGQVLRMLHDYLGDEVWWEGVRLWLNRFAFDAVDIFDFKSVFEEVSGLELYPFLEQWFLKPGHPNLEVSHEIDGDWAKLTVQQVQDTERQPVFTLYPEVLIITENGSIRDRILIDEMENVFQFEANSPILDVIVDPERVQLAQYYRDISLPTLMMRLENEHLLVRAEALSMAEDFIEHRTIREKLMGLAQNDPFWGIRFTAYGLIADHVDLFDRELVLQMALKATFENEVHYESRMEALKILHNLENINTDDNIIQNHFRVMMNDTSYFVSAEAIRLSGPIYPGEIAGMIEQYVDMESYQDVIKNAVAEALTHSTEPGAFQLLMELARQPGDRLFIQTALGHMAEHAEKIEGSMRNQAAEIFESRLSDPRRTYRLLSYRGLAVLGDPEYRSRLQEILERDPHNRDLEEQRALKDAIRTLEYLRNIDH